ncbi:ATP-dependent DNA helicase RecG [Mycolicibacillus parakoreensis]|uniref:ATP-dependent DNA helicase RecG n=1 Tax=Mycolicibacillus parakoreensis TaxID=1069221 RepID=A0ABY3TZD5_9MYCO|nr:ATP-dependent DNA helicase RecG [Mycolicibacillus parakoreensis]MCV7315839.1 ATP-dependent DNA helicase RecG [Mycolicibacillus parakoreensis]ULN51741.1 ATP-dependent DNA helicase RecG [Mycolicibacillus parakoreensis]
MATLGDRLDFVVGAKAAGHLDEAFGIGTVEELLRHYPRTYAAAGGVVRNLDDRRPQPGEHITLLDTITSSTLQTPKNPSKRGGRRFLRITLGAGAATVTATFFNATKWIAGQLTTGTRVMLSGEVHYYRGALQLRHPDFLVLDTESGPHRGSRALKRIAEASEAVAGQVVQAEFERSYYPIYPASVKLQSWDIFNCVRQVLAVLDPVADPLPEGLRERLGLLSEDEALRAVHLGEDPALRRRARDRLAFDEAVALQWALVRRRRGEASRLGPAAPRVPAGRAAALVAALPFALTAGQQEVLEVIARELAEPRPMNRLLQGEVGSGKTIVSVLAMLQLVDAGYQCALLAPTEVLAAQHRRSITAALGPMALGGQLGGTDDAIAVALLTGSMTAAQKNRVRAEISSGAAAIVIGTHALLQDSVSFHRLGMVVIDEQHRFGVEQRDRLRAKAPDGITPHLLVMTATPIPRTVALTVYGDLETSTLRELPRGRQPITTRTVFAGHKPDWLARAWSRVREEVAAGRQAYVVTSRIDDSDTADRRADGGPEDSGGRAPVTAVDGFTGLSAAALAGLRLGLLHGRLSAEEKETVMTAFRDGAIDVLVCTTVIEVGVDVPNATVMVVMDADRFGISQLHQLRGRIGRGVHPSLCLLVSWVRPASRSGRRLAAVADTVDGFALADLDLRERREGDVLGRNQSGRSMTLPLLSLAEHGELIEHARSFCADTVARDPQNPGLAALAARFTETDAIDYLDKA